MRFPLFLLIVCVAALSGGFAQEKPTQEKPTSARPQADYRLQPEDSIIISVVGEPTLNEGQTGISRKITSGGTITYPYLKSVKVVNKTPAEVEELIRTLLDKDYIIDPQVIVSIKEYRSRRVSVSGAVGKPGPYELPVEQKTDVLQIISMAGGLTRAASKSKIEVTRNGKVHKFTYDELKKIDDADKKFWLQADDLIEIGESLF